MTRKDYVLIAQTLRAYYADTLRTGGNPWLVVQLAHRFADAFVRTYPNFKRDVFIGACLEETV